VDEILYVRCERYVLDWHRFLEESFDAVEEIDHIIR
jgi:hypothetical protein